MPRRCRHPAAVTLLLVTCGLAPVRAEPPDTEDGSGAGPCTMRVATELFVDDATAPVARSLTLFHEGVAWDFLEMPTAGRDDDAPAFELVEIALHDPARERIVVVDVARHVKTQIERLQLERLGVSLASWARKADDTLVRWAGGPDFGDDFTAAEDRLELAGPRVRYAVAHVPAPSAEAATTYREFADTALLLKALVHPGGLPPFPRLAVNRRLEAAGAIPAEVTLEVDGRLAPIGGPAARLRSVHRLHPRLLVGDQRRIQEAAAQVAAAEVVDLATFAAPADAARQPATGN